jgi:hypothetical protein
LRENNYNTGLRGVLFDAEHYARMGAAVWLYGWLILRQTHQTGTIGWVLGGAPIHYREIEEETGFNRRTLERWMKMLRRQKYIETVVVDSGITVRILKAKKHLHRSTEPKTVRGIAGGVRKAAGGVPRKCVASVEQNNSYQLVANGIGSSLVVRIKEREGRGIHEAVEREEKSAAEATGGNKRHQAAPEDTGKINQNTIHKNSWSGQTQNCNQRELNTFDDDSLRETSQTQFNNGAARQDDALTAVQTQRQLPTHNHRPPEREGPRPSPQQNFSWDMRERMRLIRAERDEAVRRELAVGSGPEVRRP